MPRSEPAASSTGSEIPKGLAIALAAFAESAATARAAHEAAGIKPLGRREGFTAVGAALRTFLEQLPWESDVLPAASVPDPTNDGADWCARCHGARWLRQQGAAPGLDGLSRCQGCRSLVAVQRRDELARLAGLSDRERGRTFGTFRTPRGLEQAVRLIASWADEPAGWLAICGVPGSGKTHLALAVANSLIHREQPVRFFYTPDLVLSAREKMLGDNGEAIYFSFLRELKEAAVLVLDDLGAVKTTAWAIQEFLEPLMDARYRARRPTLLTMISDPAYLRENLSDSIGRRLQDGSEATVVEWTAPQFGETK